MEVATATPIPKMGGSDSPFRDHDVREWSRLDTITGALERAKLETDSWTAMSSDGCHKYGKVIDTRARTALDGSLAAASRQFEVFQSKSTAGTTRVQVVKTQTVSSSRWTSGANKGNSGTGVSGSGATGSILSGFENLQLAVNPLDLTSQKSKASVGRSVSRRPPTRRKEDNTSPKVDLGNTFRQHFTASQNLHRVSRLCHQIHETAVRHAFGVPSTPSISERESGDGSASGVEIVEIESTTNSNLNEKTEVNENPSNSTKSSLVRTKSTSSENINQNLETDNPSDFEDLATWRRESKIRRSLQFPKKNNSPTKPSDIPENSVNVKKIREELEKGRRLSTALRNSTLDLVTLDQIIQSVSSNSSIDKLNSSEDENNVIEGVNKNVKQKRNSFVTVESIKEVKDRLRRTSSPQNDIPVDHIDKNISNKEEQNMRTESIVKSYIFGMENLLQQNKNKKSFSGSLETKAKAANGTINHKSEDWYNRRKSYGFEKVHGDDNSSGNSLKSKKPAESSTDSGICRSNEMVPTATQRKSDSSDTDHSSDKTSPNGINYGNVRKMTSIFNSKKKNLEEDLHCNLNGQSHLDDSANDPARKKININEASINLWTKHKSNSDHLDDKKNIIWATKSKFNDWKSMDTSNKQSSITVKLRNSDNETKRHSIACDDFSTRGEPNENRFRKISPSNTDQLTSKYESSDENNRKTKKVEFCKTEIHFAAETGKVNIVETDEKPPPSQNFRRRRRNSGPTINYNNFTSKNGLPVTHFGDDPLVKNESFEKIMFGISDDETSDSRLSPEPLEYSKDEPRVPPIYGQIKSNPKSLDSDYSLKDVTRNNLNEPSINDQMISENDNLKGILKNKMKKPKPYLLGDIPLSSDSDGETHPWNIKPPTKMFNDIHDKFRSNISKENYAGERPKYQASLKTVRPTKFPDHPIECENISTKTLIPIDHPFTDSDSNQNRYSDSFTVNLRLSPVKKDVRPNSWSVTECSENDNHKEEIRWVSAGTSEKDSKSVMNKGLVVRIGNENSIPKPTTLCTRFSSLYPEKDNNKTTSTKITIDITPCLSNEHKPRFTYTKFPRSQNESFKSTPLVLDTIRTQNQNRENLRQNNLGIIKNEIKNPDSSTEKACFSFKNEAENKYTSKVAVFRDINRNRGYDSRELIKSNVSQQLEILKKFYENNQSDSDVDHEVQELMSIKENDFENKNDDNLTSNWTRVSKIKDNTNSNDLNKQEDSSLWKKAVEFKYAKNQSSFVKVKSRLNLDCVTEKDHLLNTRRSLSPNKARLSPLPLRKTSLPSYEMSNAVFAKDDLSSPSLVTRNSVSNYAVVNRMVKNNNLTKQPPTKDEDNRLHKYENIQFRKSRERATCLNKIKTTREISPTKNNKIDSDYEPIEFRGVESKLLRDPSPNKILRQPKDSEMTYFGVKSEQKVATNVKTNDVIKEIKNNKPDLIQHCNKRLHSPNVIANFHASPTIKNEHTYENVNFKKKEFDRSILDELTKAADQILQAVNGYTDEDSIKNSKYESEDDYKQPLDTISETKSWKTSNISNIALHARKPTLASAAKVRVKRTSSTSSIESLSRDRRGSFGGANERQKKEETVKSGPQKEANKKKSLSDTSSTKTSTKATRRIQRACSRELLLQSHGSSSEDLQLETPVRKPRLLKKTKTSQVTVNTCVDLKRPERERNMEKPAMGQDVKKKNAFEERAVVPEIKHKPAVSVVRNIKSEKVTRDRSRPRSEDRSSVAKLSSNRESVKVSGTVTASSRSTSKQGYQSSSSRLLDGTQNKENSNVTQHRISTANIKKCRRTEGTKSKH